MGVHKNNETSSGETETNGYSSDCILGRHTDYAPFKGGNPTDYSPDMSDVQSPGVDGKQGKISVHSTTRARVPGVLDELSLSAPRIPNQENEENSTECPNLDTPAAGVNKRHSKVCGESLSLSKSYLAGPLHYRALQHMMNSVTPMDQPLALRTTKFNVKLNLTEGAKMDLSWWISLSQNSMMVSPLLPHTPDMTIESDTPNTGWRARQGEVQTGGMWSKKGSLNHIYYLELLTAFLALQCFTKQKSNITVQLRMDNLTAMTYINRMGGTHSQVLCSLAISVWDWSLQQNIYLAAEYLPGKRTQWPTMSQGQ